MKRSRVFAIAMLVAASLFLSSCPRPEPGPVLPPGPSLLAPAGLATVATSESAITLSWTDRSSGETGVKVERSPDGSSSWTWVTTTAANAESLEDAGLAASTPYYYRVCATNGRDDSEWSNTASATTLAPPPGGGTLVISEVGSCPFTNSSSWLEVYNPSSEPAQLSQFQLRTYARLKASPYGFDGIVTFTLPPLLVQPGSYALIRGKTRPELVNGTRVVYIDDALGRVPNWVSDAASSGAGSGFVELVSGGATVDFVRFGSNTADPLTGGTWSGGDASALPTGTGNYGISISRDGTLTDTNAPGDWALHASATAGGPNDVTSDTDADADGIPDSCEVLGSTFAGLQLYDWGARTGQKDIFIHIDHMSSTDPACTPRRAALDSVVAAFAARGITVHFDAGTLFGSKPADYNLDNTSHQVPFATAIGFEVQAGMADLYAYKNTYMNLAKKQVFHYLLMGYSQNTDGSSGSSGIAEMNGNDLIVTLGNWGLDASTAAQANRLTNYQASTIMHEFGHNLGLDHGGNVSTNYMPSYVSIMNYMYQLTGLPTIGTSEGDRYYYYRLVHLDEDQGYQWSSYLPSGYSSLTNSGYTTTFIMDYSDGTGGSIAEVLVFENEGLCRAGSSGVDFNGDGDATDTISKDLNADGTKGTLTDYNDWAHLNLFFQRASKGDASGVLPEDFLNIAPDPVGDDRQEVHTETLYRWMAE